MQKNSFESQFETLSNYFADLILSAKNIDKYKYLENQIALIAEKYGFDRRKVAEDFTKFVI